MRTKKDISYLYDGSGGFMQCLMSAVCNFFGLFYIVVIVMQHPNPLSVLNCTAAPATPTTQLNK